VLRALVGVESGSFAASVAIRAPGHSALRGHHHAPISTLLCHLGIGRPHARTEIICLVHGNHATVITYTGDVLGEYTINPEKDY
jgi:hypothetical protein